MSPHERDEAKPPSRPFPTFTRYEVRAVLGEGATSVVYSAWDRELHRPVAIKLLRETAGLSELARQRFRREAQAAAGMAHPNVVTLYDAGEQDGRPYLVLELVEGKSLSETLQKNPGFRREHVELLAKAAHGAGAVHAKGIVHRDLKPGNILVTPTGEPKIGDFGLVHLEGTTLELTRAGATLGTPYYMAPEQVESRPGKITPRTDVYGLGAILYEILTGRAPHAAESLNGLYRKILVEDPIRVRAIDPHIPPDLEAIALKALSKDPGDRYANGDEFAEDLGRYLTGQPVKAKPPSFADEIRKTWVRNRPVFLTAGIGLTLALIVAALLLPRWLDEKKVREQAEKGRERAEKQRTESETQAWDVREKAIRDLLSLWSDVLIAKQGWYQAQKDPGETRGKIEEVVRTLGAFVERHPDQPQGYYIRARASLHLDDLEKAEADLKKATTLAPGFGPAWALLGRVYLEQMWEAALRNKILKASNVEESKAYLQRATDAFAKVPASASGTWGLDRIDEEAAAAPLARALLLAFSENNLPKAKELVLDLHRQSPNEETALMLGQLSPESGEQIRWYSEALRMRPHFFKAYFNRGSSKENLKDLAGAEADYDVAIKINPHHPITFLNRAYVRSLRKNYSGSLDDVAEILRLKPGFGQALTQRASVLLVLKDFKGAQVAVDEALRQDPNLLMALALRAFLRCEAGDLAAALRDVDRSIELGPRYGYARLTRGVIRFRKGDLPGAIEDCNAAVSLDPSSAAAYAQRAMFRALQLDAKGAHDDFSEGIRLDPEFAEAYSGRAAMRLALGENQGAYDDAARAIKLNGQFSAAYSNRALAEIRFSRLEAAIETTTQALKIDPKNADAYGYRGLAKAMQGNFSEALDDLNQAISLAPTNAQFLTNRAELRSRFHDYQGAIEDATEAIRAAPGYGDPYRNRGVARLGLGDFKGGIDDSTEAIKRNPSDATAYSNRASAKVLTKEYAGAIEDATKALELTRSFGQPYATRAMASLRLEKWSAARDDSNAGLKLLPTHPDLFFCRALAAEKLSGQDAAAALPALELVRQDLEKALELGGFRWMYRAEAEAALLRVRERRGEPAKK